jgi:hypothetical protein
MTNHIETDYTPQSYIDPHSGHLTFYKPDHPLYAGRIDPTVYGDE